MHKGTPLQHLARQVRGRTIRILTQAPESALLWAPAGLQNHILWHAGHALWLGDVLCIEPATGVSELPAGWASQFGMNCVKPSDQTSWPSRSELLGLLSAQGDRLFKLVGELTADQLNSLPQGRESDESLVGWIVHGMHDEAIHQGEMKLLLKLAGR